MSGHDQGGAAGFTSISEAVEAFGRGEMLLVVDDERRENEGDLIVAASYSPDGKEYEDGIYRGNTDCRVISTFPWEVIRDMLNTLHIEVPDQ